MSIVLSACTIIAVHSVAMVNMNAPTIAGAFFFVYFQGGCPFQEV